MKAPFPYFGGKTKVAGIVWAALGECGHYIEPFFGSGAVLLARPNFDPTKHIETVCDTNGFVANVWRALKFKPNETAEWCDWPVNHADLIARKAALIRNEARLLEELCKDEQWCDPIMAGYWIWTAGCWIGSGMTRPTQIPRLCDGGAGVHAKGKRPHLCRGKGVHAKGKIHHLCDGGAGVHAKGKRPHLCDTGADILPRNENIYNWFREIARRLRNVRVVCGDWSCVCGGNWQDGPGRPVGIFFDPPYGVSDRDTGIYDKHDDLAISAKVRAWCLERGKLKDYRIVLAGYELEHGELEKHGWTAQAWSAQGGYGNIGGAKGTQGQANRHRETLWFSPNCLRQETLF